MNEGMLSPADVAVLSGNTSRNNDGFGDGNGAWWIILFLIFGWGRNGFGGGYGAGNGGGIGENYVLATDFANIERKLDGVNSGICDSTFALNNTINNGYFGLQNALCQGFNGLNVAYLQGTNSISSQLANCCCDIRQQIADCCCTTQRGLDSINYNMAMNTNGIQQTLCNNTRDIIENQNANYRALHDEIVANRIEDKNAQITAQQNEINSLRLAASQERQNAYLLSELKPCPSAAYIVPNPNCCYNYNVTGYGYGKSGCNFGNF
jgi:hypothetical protein